LSLEEHLARPDISIEQHIASRAAALAASLENKLPIYLDTRFWIMVREVEDGTSNRDDEIEIVRLLRSLVEGGRAYCPIAEPTFSEVMRQAQPARRAGTARAIDALSLGVTILPDCDRMAGEIRNALRARVARSAAPPPFRGLTSLAYVLGDLYPAGTVFPAETELALQKAFYDRLWDKPLAEIVLMMPVEHYTRDQALEERARRRTDENAAHRHLMKSWEDVLGDEFQGAGRGVAEMVPGLMELILPSAPVDAETAQKLIGAAIRQLLADPANARAMPTMHVQAAIHALFRWEYRDRPITANDLVDFRHAAAALSHCALFLTEKGLRNTLLHQRIRLADLHGTTVLASRGEIVRHLRQLAA